MNCQSLLTTISGTLVFLSAAAAQAQPPPEPLSRWNVEVASGVAATTGAISDRLTSGWNINLGAGYYINRTLEIEGNFTFNDLGVSSQVLTSLQVPDANARLMSLTAGPKVHFPIASNVNGYVMGGAGWYRRTVDFTQPTVGVIDIVDPWWGYLGSAIVPANQVIGSVSDNAWGVNGGGGVSVALGQSGVDVFAEIRYHYAHMNPTTTSIVPITFGVRFGGQKR
jgi:opacity protein-like surface antigen